MTKSAWRTKNENLATEALKGVKDLRRRLERTPSKNQMFREIVLDLADYLAGQLTKLVGPDGQSPQAVALICRNLLEIDIITKYCLALATNFRDIVDDTWIDGKQIFEYLREWVEYKEPGRRIAELDTTIANFGAKITNAGISRSKPLDLHDLAEKAEMVKEYKCLNKVTSKLVHATAFSIWAYEDKGEMELMVDFMLSQAIFYSAEVYQRIKDHVATKGMEP
jgi:hypothetical protein